MLSKRVILLLSLQAFLLATLGKLTAQDQDVFRFKGPLTINEFRGEAEYDYSLIEGDTLLTGPFRFQSSNLNALMKASDKSFRFSGNFLSGLSDGQWNFQFGEFKTDSTTKVVDFQYRLNVSGIQNKSSGKITRGKPNGRWAYEVLNVKNSEVRDTLFRSEFDFDGGVPQKNFEIKNKQGTLVGRFLRNGLAHDVWDVYLNDDPDGIEKWHFSNGRLVKISYGTSEKSQIIDVFERPFENSRSVVLDSRYLALLQLLEKRTGDHIGFKATMPKLFKENISHYEELDTFFSALGSPSFMPEFKVAVPLQPLDSLKASQLDSVSRLVTQSAKISESLLKNTQMNILKRSDPEVSYLAAVLQILDSSYLAPLKKLQTYNELEIIGYISDEEITEDLWPNGMPEPKIVVTVNGGDNEVETREYVGPKANSFDFSGNLVSSALKVANYLNLSLNDISEVLEDKLDKQEREQALVLLEEQMVGKADSLIHYIDSIVEHVEPREVKALSLIRKGIERQLNDYSNLEVSQGKSDSARKLVDCFDHFRGLTKSVVDLRTRSPSVEEKFHDRVWNPFTATLMDDVVKKRIINAYLNILQPFVLDQITAEMNCLQVKEVESLLENIHNRVAELRDEDTSKLERKLKRERNPEVILELFNLGTNNE